MTRARFPNSVRFAGALALAAFLAVGFTPLGSALHDTALEVPGDDRPCQAIVVLGAGVSMDGVLSAQSLRRLVHGIALWRAGRAPKLILLGPRSTHGPVEAEVRAALARDLGVPADAIVVEAGGRTTREEGEVVARRLAGPAPREVVLVTGVYHMARARALFERAGLTVRPAPVSEAPARPLRPGERLSVAWMVAQEWAAHVYNRVF